MTSFEDLQKLFPAATQTELLEFSLYPDNELTAKEIAEHVVGTEEGPAWADKAFYVARTRLADNGNALNERKKSGVTLYSLCDARQKEIENVIRAAKDRAVQKEYADSIREDQALASLRRLSNEELVSHAAEYLDATRDLLIEAVSTGKTSLTFDFKTLAQVDPELADSVLEDPKNALKSFEIAAHQLEGVKDFEARFTNLPDSAKRTVRALTVKDLGRFLEIEGMVRSVTQRRPRVVSARFECPGCSNIASVLQVSDRFLSPNSCGCGRKGKFKVLSKELVDTIRFKLEELPEQLAAQQMARHLLCTVTRDLTASGFEKRLYAGSRVRLSGVVEEIPKTTKRGQASVDYDLTFNVNSVVFLHDDFRDVEITADDKEFFKEFAEFASTNPEAALKSLGHALAPDIVGLDDPRLALIACIFSRDNEILDDGSKVRRVIHVLIPGDPGTAKSELGKALGRVVPRSRYATCEQSSGVGLTAGVVRDELTGEWHASGGVLVMANQSLAILDEFDKAHPEDTASLHSALENGEITIDKANVHQTLQANTRVVALGNPKETRFDPMKPLGEQLPNVSSLLNRFALIPPILDDSNDNDDDIADAIYYRQYARRNRTTN